MQGVRELYFTDDGHVSRRDYWLKFVIPGYGLPIFLMIAMPPDILSNPSPLVPTAVGIIVVAFYWLSIVGGIKRAHDRNYPEVAFALSLVPMFGQLWGLIDLGCLRGTRGENRFGPDPVQHRA
jgi:uncharacterized membrane protein YhaH (DUF805 family)